MDNKEHDNDWRFEKLYELLGDVEVSKEEETDTPNGDNSSDLEQDIVEETKHSEDEQSAQDNFQFRDVFNIFNDNGNISGTEKLDLFNNTISDNNLNTTNDFAFKYDFVDDTNGNEVKDERPKYLMPSVDEIIKNNNINNARIASENATYRELFANEEEETPKPENTYVEPTNIKLGEIVKEEPVVETEEENKPDRELLEDKTEKFRNKTLIPKKLFDDDLDSALDEKRFIDIISSKKTLGILLILVFIVVCVLVIKAFYFGKLVKIYNEYTDEVDHGNSNTVVYEDDDINDDTLRKVAAEELLSCIKTPLDVNNLPDNINQVIKNINNYYRSSSNNFAFLYKDIYTGFTVSYNENGKIFAASAIKAPVSIYLYNEASKGNISLDEELTYTSNYYNNGTGVLKEKEVNTKYSVKTLLSYAIKNSDNAAHNMLMDKYGKDNIYKYWKEKGTNTIFTGNDNWGLLSAHDAKIYMSELYNFYINDTKYGTDIMNDFIGATTKFITGKNEYIVANKSGWSGSSQHDVAIVFAENPYIVVALSNYGYDNNYMSYFNKVNDLAYELHTEYWKYKTAKCSEIRQYN